MRVIGFYNMPIYLNDQQKDYLKLKLKNIYQTDFIGKKILKEIASDDRRLKRIEDCEHEKGEYEGKREACVKCDKFYFESFERKEL